MTPDEIQALRETHHSDGHILVERCFGCGDDWPCDVGEVLDAWEAERKVQACDHCIPDPFTSRPTLADEFGHIFCPKCGVKL